MSSVSMMPGGPLDLPSTQALLRQRMEQGDITQEDVNILKRGYRWMIVSAMVGASAGIPFYLSMGRRKPPITMGRKVIATWFVASTGSFLGFTIGGAAAALEVNTNMQDSQRKMRVFEEVMVESKRLAEEQRAGRIPRPDRFPSSTTYDNSPGTSSSGSRMDDDLKGVSMSGFENEGKVFAGENPDGAERRRELEREGQVGTSGIRQATESTWDRIRSGETPNPSSPKTPSDPSARPSSSPFASSSRSNAPMSDSRASPSSREQFGRPTNLSTRDLDIKIDSLGGSKGDLGSTGEIMGLGGAVEERDRERDEEKREFQMLMDRERNIGGKEEGFETGRWK